MFHFLLQVKDEDRTCSQIIFWWEQRRILYNIVVGIVGFFCWGMIQKLSPQYAAIVNPFSIVSFACLCNIAYCLGWFTESLLLTYAKATGNIHCNPGTTYGPFCFRLGLWFTLFVMFLPVALWSIVTFLIHCGFIHGAYW